MRRISEALKSILGFVVVILAAIIGIVLAVLSFVWFLIPRIRKEEREKVGAEAEARVATMKAEIQKAHEERAEAVETKVSEIDKKAADQRAQDSVALANDLLKEDP